jgi:hypothetical protein
LAHLSNSSVLWIFRERRNRKEMLIVETIRKIRQAYHRDKKPIREIVRDFYMSRTTVRNSEWRDPEFAYSRKEQPLPKLGAFEERLLRALSEDAVKTITSTPDGAPAV